MSSSGRTRTKSALKSDSPSSSKESSASKKDKSKTKEDKKDKEKNNDKYDKKERDRDRKEKERSSSKRRETDKRHGTKEQVDVDYGSQSTKKDKKKGSQIKGGTLGRASGGAAAAPGAGPHSKGGTLGRSFTTKVEQSDTGKPTESRSKKSGEADKESKRPDGREEKADLEKKPKRSGSRIGKEDLERTLKSSGSRVERHESRADIERRMKNSGSRVERHERSNGKDTPADKAEEDRGKELMKASSKPVRKRSSTKIDEESSSRETDKKRKEKGKEREHSRSEIKKSEGRLEKRPSDVGEKTKERKRERSGTEARRDRDIKIHSSVNEQVKRRRRTDSDSIKEKGNKKESPGVERKHKEEKRPSHRSEHTNAEGDRDNVEKDLQTSKVPEDKIHTPKRLKEDTKEEAGRDGHNMVASKKEDEGNVKAEKRQPEETKDNKEEKAEQKKVEEQTSKKEDSEETTKITFIKREEKEPSKLDNKKNAKKRVLERGAAKIELALKDPSPDEGEIEKKKEEEEEEARRTLELLEKTTDMSEVSRREASETEFISDLLNSDTFKQAVNAVPQTIPVSATNNECERRSSNTSAEVYSILLCRRIRALMGKTVQLPRPTLKK